MPISHYLPEPPSGKQDARRRSNVTSYPPAPLITSVRPMGGESWAGRKVSGHPCQSQLCPEPKDPSRWGVVVGGGDTRCLGNGTMFPTWLPWRLAPPDPFQGGLHSPLGRVGWAGSLNDDLSPHHGVLEEDRWQSTPATPRKPLGQAW